MNQFKTWDHDPAARAAYRKAQELLGPALRELFPGYELQQLGIGRDEFSPKVTIKLHLVPRGEHVPLPPEPGVVAPRLPL